MEHGDPKATLPWRLPAQPRGLPCARVSGAHTCHCELRGVALVDLRPGGQVDGPAEVDAAVVALGSHDAHEEVLPTGQWRDTEALVVAGLAAVLGEGGQLVCLVAGAHAVPVEDEVLRLTGEAAGEGGVCPLGHDQPGGGEGEGAPGPAGGLCGENGCEVGRDSPWPRPLTFPQPCE